MSFKHPDLRYFYKLKTEKLEKITHIETRIFQFNSTSEIR